MKKKIVSIFITALISLIALSGCDYSKPLIKGFGGVIGMLDPIMVGVKSNRSVFDINDVTLDFYYGGECIGYGKDDSRKTYGVALYFCNETEFHALDIDVPYQDYSDIKGLYFVKFISAEEFNTDEYKVDVSMFRTKFKHHEKFTVPSEIFTKDSGSFYLIFVDLYILKEEPYYYRSNGGGGDLRIWYKYENEHTVRLS